MSDLRDAIRALRGTPVVTAAAVLSLALGIGANTAIFSILDTLMLKALPVRDPQQLVQLGTTPVRTSWSNPLWEQLRDHHQDLFEGAFAYSPQQFNLARSGEAAYVNGMFASGGIFDVLGVPVIIGRGLTPADDVRGGGATGPVAVITYGFWQRHYGGAADVLGQHLALDRIDFTVVGVLGHGFAGLDQGRQLDVAIPLGAEPLMRGAKASMMDERSSWWLRVFGRLHPGQTPEQAETALRAIQPQLRAATIPQNWRAADLPRYLKDPFPVRAAANGPASMARQYRAPLLTLMTVVAIVLLIACANVANLLLARAAGRRHEISLRLALGASPGRIARQLLTESLLLSATGAALGLLFAQWSARLLVRQLSTQAAVVALDLSLDWRMLSFAAAVAIATALLFGTIPALRATRVPPNESIKAQGRGIAGDATFSVGNLLVAGQVALCLVLMVGAGLFVRTFTALAHVDLGFNPDPVLMVRVDGKRSAVPLPARQEMFERVRNAVLQVPGVQHAALSVIQPVSGSEWDTLIENQPGQSLPESDRQVNVNKVSAGWFATYGTPVLAGRDVDARDRRDAPPVILVNEAFVRKFLNGGSAIGQRVREVGGGRDDSPSPAWEIVGVVKDAVYLSPRDVVPPTMYQPLQQGQAGSAQSLFLAVRAQAGHPAQLTRSVNDAIMHVDPDLTLSYAPFSDSLRSVTTEERILAIVSGFFGALALLLAAVGLYGVISYAVQRRRTEIGIRMALGSGPRGAIGLVVRRVAWLVGAGGLAGIALALWAGRYVAALMFGLQPRDPLTLSAAFGILVLTAGVAAALPALRAARIDPARVLREG